jgi:hypothetical protein
MNLNELESLWHQQPAGASNPAAAVEMTRRLTQRLDRRSLYLKLLFGCTLAGLLLEFEPLFRLLRTQPAYEGFRFGAERAKFFCHQALYGTLLVFLFRRLRQQAQQVRASGESLHTAVAMSLAGAEGEMADYRKAAWFALPATALMLWSAWLNQAVAREGFAAFWPRAAFVLSFCAALAAVARYYYTSQLAPERQRLRDLARDWGNS